MEIVTYFNFFKSKALCMRTTIYAVYITVLPCYYKLSKYYGIQDVLNHFRFVVFKMYF